MLLQSTVFHDILNQLGQFRNKENIHTTSTKVEQIISSSFKNTINILYSFINTRQFCVSDCSDEQRTNLVFHSSLAGLFVNKSFFRK